MQESHCCWFWVCALLFATGLLLGGYSVDELKKDMNTRYETDLNDKNAEIKRLGSLLDEKNPLWRPHEREFHKSNPYLSEYFPSVAAFCAGQGIALKEDERTELYMFRAERLRHKYRNLMAHCNAMETLVFAAVQAIHAPNSSTDLYMLLVDSARAGIGVGVPYESGRDPRFNKTMFLKHIGVQLRNELKELLQDDNTVYDQVVIPPQERTAMMLYVSYHYGQLLESHVANLKNSTVSYDYEAPCFIDDKNESGFNCTDYRAMMKKLACGCYVFQDVV